MDCEVVRNSFARESFLNVADEDYIAARCAYRLGLMNHFLWSAMQAVEKYLKAILLFNGEKAAHLGHDIETAYEIASKIHGIGVSLPPEQLALLRHVNRNGLNRYREISAYTRGDELRHLDLLIWYLRRFCQPFRTTLRRIDGTQKDMFALNVARINDPDFFDHPYRFKLIGGFLEKVLDAPRRDLRRVNLVWGNACFGPGKVQRMRRSHSVNAFLSRYPEEVDCLREFVYIPKAHLADIERLRLAKQKRRNGADVRH